MDTTITKEQHAEATLKAFAIVVILKQTLGDQFDNFFIKLKENNLKEKEQSGYRFSEDSQW